MKWLVAILVLCVAALYSCSKDPVGAKVPKITFAGISSQVHAGSAEFINLSLKFEDGDADIGNGDPTGPCGIYILEKRLGFYTEPFSTINAPYAIPKIEDEFKDPAKGLTGSLLAQIPAAFFTIRSVDSPYYHIDQDHDTLQFEVYIKDIAGNESNHITTSDVILIR
jgi:hypothetical protein